MEKKKALGRGMASLIPGVSIEKENTASQKSFFYCDIENLIPNKEQPRKTFNEEKILELSNSIREKGIIQPIIVRRLSDFQFEIIAGERRWRAAQRANLKQVPVIIRESLDSDKLEEALIENIQREDLNAMEEALAYQKLIEEHAYTHDILAQKLGKDRSTIANTLRLLSLPQSIQTLIVEGKISEGHAKALLSLQDPGRQEAIAKEIMKKGLSVRQVEALTRTYSTKNSAAKQKDAFVVSLEEELSQRFKTKVKISLQGQKGKIEIEYYNQEDLNRIISLLRF